jgi:hypothetical protein
VACPFFMPIEKLENGMWQHPARLPLGNGWTGHCTAPGHEGEVPALEILRESCNLGYSKSCGCLPQVRAWDAVRFAISARRNRADEAAEQLRNRVVLLDYACERDHRPVDHGQLAFDLVESKWAQRHGDDRVQKMAVCFLQAYLEKKKVQTAGNVLAALDSLQS